MPPAPRPTRAQVEATAEVTRWYVARYWRTTDDAGVPAVFCDPSQVGHFAVTPEELKGGDDAALFRLLVATTMFQRRQDVQILRVLRGTGAEDAAALTQPACLLGLVDASPCERIRTTRALHEECDLTKDSAGRGACEHRSAHPCHLKRHSELLRRYGHFGKVPTSAALVLREAGVEGLSGLYKQALLVSKDPDERAVWLQAALSRAWRVSDKISSMFLSALTNPDLSDGLTPWRRGLNWRRFVVVDSNADLFLASIQYQGAMTYEARRAFFCALARRVKLDGLDARLQRYNPRIVQQAAYLFMSVTNRRARASDCMHLAPLSCATCEATLRHRCAAKPAGTA
jgi:hypothetical protein